MTSGAAQPDRPDIAAATRGGDDSLGMEDEVDPANASLEQALFWRGIYSEILEMEESVLARIRQLMAQQSPQARREVELTNVPVVVSQVERFRYRWEIWDSRVDGPRIGRCDVVTTAPQPEEQPVPGQAPTELSSVESPAAPQSGRTRISAVWFGVVAAALVLVLLLIFILQNTRSVKVTFFTVSGTVPVGVALLFAALTLIIRPVSV